MRYIKKNIFVVLIVASLMSQGCAAVLLGGGVYAVCKAKKRKPKFSEMQRRVVQTNEIEGSREDVLRATVTIFQDRGYNVENSDYEGGIVTASNDKPYLQINAMVEEFTETRIKMRITMKDEDCVLEDETVYMKLFDDIQTEVFRRVNIKN